MPTNTDYPWLRDQRRTLTGADPIDPAAAAALHKARQSAAINDARAATSKAPPWRRPQKQLRLF